MRRDLAPRHHLPLLMLADELGGHEPVAGLPRHLGRAVGALRRAGVEVEASGTPAEVAARVLDALPLLARPGVRE